MRRSEAREKSRFRTGIHTWLSQALSYDVEQTERSKSRVRCRKPREMKEKRWVMFQR